MEIQEYRPKILYDGKFQQKLLKIMLEQKDETFSLQIIDVIEGEYFDNTYLKILFNHVKYYYNSYGLIPNYETVTNVLTIKEHGIQQENLIDTLKGLERMSMTDKSHEKAFAIIEEAKKVGQPKTSGHSYVNDVEKRMIKKQRLPIPTMEGLNM